MRSIRFFESLGSSFLRYHKVPCAANPKLVIELPGSKTQIFSNTFSSISPVEASFLIQIISKDLSTQVCTVAGGKSYYNVRLLNVQRSMISPCFPGMMPLRALGPFQSVLERMETFGIECEEGFGQERRF